MRYLPYTIDAAHGRNSGARAESRGQARRDYAFDPPAARLEANVPDAPGLAYGSLDPTTRGALIVYQSDHGLPATGDPDGSTWASLLAAETLGHGDPTPYTFVTVSESSPRDARGPSRKSRGDHDAREHRRGRRGNRTRHLPDLCALRVHDDDRHQPGRHALQDPGVPWVNYFNGGDAVHGFPRASYGFPQSNGCVELPIGTAAQVYPLLAIGDLVIVSG